MMIQFMVQVVLPTGHHHPARAELCFSKWQDKSVETELEYIEWSCATSNYSIIAFKPVE